MELFTGNGDEVKMMMMNIIRLMTIIMMLIMRIILMINMLIVLIMMIMMVIIPRELFDYYQAGGLETAEELEVLFETGKSKI